MHQNQRALATRDTEAYTIEYPIAYLNTVAVAADVRRYRRFPSARSLPFLALPWVFACASSGSHNPVPDGAAGAVASADATYQPPSATALAAREQTADQQVQQVLNRLAFGPRPGDVATVRSMGVDRWIEQQLHPERIRDTAVTSFLAQYKTLNKSSEELYADYPPPKQALAQIQREKERRGERVTAEDSARVREQARLATLPLSELTSSRVARAALSERQLEEVMVDFWENHFNVFSGKDRVRYYLPEYDAQVIRPHVLGKFRDLLGAVAHSEAMIYYLDNWRSAADSGRPVLEAENARNRGRSRATARTGAGNRPTPRRPTGTTTPNARRLPPPPAPPSVAQVRRGLNENYARELMELHTLGVDGGYTQQDVIEVARALTGWTLDRGAQGGTFVFKPEMHDAGAKTILGQRFPAGRGIEEGEAVLDLLARSPKTATFIATKLARRFVSDTPPAALVERAAETFRATEGDIRAVVRTIVTSPEFFSAAAYRAKVKSPFELVVSTVRAMDAAPDPTPRTALIVSRLGQPIFGHQAPNGYPETGDAWMNTGAILSRINFGLSAAGGGVPGITLKAWPAARTLEPLPRDQQVDGVIRELLGGAASPDTRAVLLSGTNPFLNQRRSEADTALMVSADPMTANAVSPAEPQTRGPRKNGSPEVGSRRGGNARGAAAGRTAALTGFAQIVGLALGAPEFQRR